MKPGTKVNYYDVLEVSPRARPEVISAAYKVLMKLYHPDVNEGKGDIAQLLNEASDTLLNPASRADYDRDRSSLEGKIIKDYRVIKEIADGGFGKTYYGEHVMLGAPVCLKNGHYVSPQDERILMEEAASIWDLRHYSIPTMRDFFKLEDGSPVLVMSYVPGPTLGRIIEKNKKLDPENVAWITERSLNALKYLHYNGVVHGDVKPQNFIVQPDSHMVVLVDYGLSLIRPSENSSSKGYTPMFASPEQISGKPLVPESDFYSLGMTMLYALGGDPLTRRVPADVPDSLCDFIKKLIVRDVIQRPNWRKEDLAETISNIRQKEFGRRRSGMKPIPGF